MKRFFAAITALVLALSLFACGKSTAEKWQEQYDTGMKFLTELNYEEAIIAFTAAIKIDPKNAETYLGRASAYIFSGETEETLRSALADYEKAVELDETNVDAWLGLADVYIRMGEYDMALEVLREALDKTGNDPSIAEKIAELESGSITDSSGNIRRRSHYNGIGALIGYFTYTYDNEGWRKTVTAYDAAGNQVDYGENTRTDMGNISQETSYMEYIEEDAVWLQKVVSEFTTHDDGSSEESQTYYDRDGNIDSYGRNYYDSEHKCVKSEYYDLDGALMDYSTCTYDAAGRLVRDSQYLEDGTLVAYTEIEYDENENASKISRYDSDGQLTSYTLHKYDAAGNYLGSEDYDGDGNLQNSSVVDE